MGVAYWGRAIYALKVAENEMSMEDIFNMCYCTELSLKCFYFLQPFLHISVKL